MRLLILENYGASIVCLPKGVFIMAVIMVVSMERGGWHGLGCFVNGSVGGDSGGRVAIVRG